MTDTKSVGEIMSQPASNAANAMNTMPVKHALQYSSPITSADINVITKQIEQRAVMLDRVHNILWSRLKPQTDLVVVGKGSNASIRFTKSFARLTYGIVGGNYSYIKDSAGEPMVQRHDYEDPSGSYYVFTAYSEYTLPSGHRVEASGSCSSRAPFFGIADGDIRAVQDVNEDNVRRAALSDAFKNAIWSGVGMRQPTMSDLERHKIDMSSAASFDFATGTQSTKAADTKDEKDMREEIQRLCKEVYEAGIASASGSPFVNTAAVLKEATTNDSFNGWQRFDRISQKAIRITYKNVKAFHAKAMEAVHADAGTTKKEGS